jgi:hypothetical protein
MNFYVPTKPECPVMVGSSRTHPNKTVPRRRTRKRSHHRNKQKKFLQPLVDFTTRLVLHDKTDSERTRHQRSHHNEGEISRGPSYNSVSLLDFPEIKWVDDDENDHDGCFHFRQGGYKGSPDGIFVDHLVHQEDQSRVLQESALTLRRQRRSLQRCLLRSKTIRRDLAGTISNNHESCSTRELVDLLVEVPSKEKKSHPAAIPNETWLLETKPSTISLCYKQQQEHWYRDNDLTASVPALSF